MNHKIVRAYTKNFADYFLAEYPSATILDVDNADARITLDADDYLMASRNPQHYTGDHKRPEQTGPCWVGIPIVQEGE